MKRTTQSTDFEKADKILTADWHLREDTPTCRTDNFYEKQWKKLDFISELQRKHRCDVVHSGDLFDFWKPSPMLLSKTMQHLPKQFYTVYGNHDLPQHNIELAYKSGVYTLEKAGVLKVYPTCHWKETPTKPSFFIGSKGAIYRKILVWHVMTYQTLKPWPGCTSPKGSKLLRKYPQFDLIVTGDNHKPFVEKHEGRLLVNAGSIFRMTADQQEHKPRVYLWYAATNTVKPVYLPIDENVISRKHLEETEKRNDRIDAFISTLDEDWEANMSFEDNIEKFKEINNVRESVMEIVYKVIED